MMKLGDDEFMPKKPVYGKEYEYDPYKQNPKLQDLPEAEFEPIEEEAENVEIPEASAIGENLVGSSEFQADFTKTPEEIELLEKKEQLEMELGERKKEREQKQKIKELKKEIRDIRLEPIKTKLAPVVETGKKVAGVLGREGKKTAKGLYHMGKKMYEESKQRHLEEQRRGEGVSLPGSTRKADFSRESGSGISVGSSRNISLLGKKKEMTIISRNKQPMRITGGSSSNIVLGSKKSNNLVFGSKKGSKLKLPTEK